MQNLTFFFRFILRKKRKLKTKTKYWEKKNKNNITRNELIEVRESMLKFDNFAIKSIWRTKSY